MRTLNVHDKLFPNSCIIALKMSAAKQHISGFAVAAASCGRLQFLPAGEVATLH
jgi:hypothetical protein